MKPDDPGAPLVMSPTPTGRRRNRKPRHRSGPVIGPEVRINSSRVELRTPADDSSGDVIEVFGRAIVYNADYTVRDMFGEFTERMASGVANDVLATCDCRYLFNHDGLPLARSISGTLTLEDTARWPRHVAASTSVRVSRTTWSSPSSAATSRRCRAASSSAMTSGTRTTTTGRSSGCRTSSTSRPSRTRRAPTTSTSLAKRYMMSMPSESRSRVRKAWTVAREMREGKVISAANAKLLTDALEALHRADDSDITDIVERLQTSIRRLTRARERSPPCSTRPTPTATSQDLEPALMPASSETSRARSVPRRPPRRASRGLAVVRRHDQPPLRGAVQVARRRLDPRRRRRLGRLRVLHGRGLRDLQGRLHARRRRVQLNGSATRSSSRRPGSRCPSLGRRPGERRGRRDIESRDADDRGHRGPHDPALDHDVEPTDPPLPPAEVVDRRGLSRTTSPWPRRPRPTSRPTTRSPRSPSKRQPPRMTTRSARRSSRPTSASQARDGTRADDRSRGGGRSHVGVRRTRSGRRTIRQLINFGPDARRLSPTSATVRPRSSARSCRWTAPTASSSPSASPWP
jgi:hypothetical protein